MRNDVNRQWLLKSRPHGMVGPENFEWKESATPEIGDGEILVRNLYLSFDPTQRGWLDDRPSYVPPVQIGEVMRAGSVAQVVESRHQGFDEGDVVQGTFGWQDFAVSDGSGLTPVSKVPDGVPITAPLSVFGITGLTAYFGMLDLGEPKEGETVLVSGAAGATGSVAGQIAKTKGARVIGIAGGEEKCSWLTGEAGYDAAIDYKHENVGARLDELCPKGIDIYFDNVGGDILDEALARLAMKARVVLCGGISRYNDTEPAPGPKNYFSLIIQRARMEGFIVLDYAERFPDAVAELAAWVGDGSLVYKEDIREGLENAPETLVRLFTGKNFGKQLLKVAELK